MKVLLVNNNGGGFAKEIEIIDNTNIKDFCLENVVSEDEEEDIFESNKWKIRVNRELVTSSYILQNNDRVTVTPVSIKGA